MNVFHQEYKRDKTIPNFKNKANLMIVICWILLIFGSVSLLVSIIFNSQIFAFIGLGLIFWGAILLFVQPEDYVKKVLFDATNDSELAILNQLLKELDYKGKPIYLPPKYFKDAKTTKVYISRVDDNKTPDLKLISDQENKFFLKNNKGILFEAPGSKLANLFEQRLKIDFTKSSLMYIQKNFPHVFINDLELAESIEIEIKTNQSVDKNGVFDSFELNLKLKNSSFQESSNNLPDSSGIYESIGSPVSSAIAIMLSKVTGKPIIIKEIEHSEHSKDIAITYCFEKIEYIFPDPMPKVIEPVTTKFISSYSEILPSLVMIVLGAFTLIWIIYLTFLDLNLFNKDIFQILFSYRPNETISLGIGMKFIHYYLMGLAFSILGILLYFKGTKKTILWAFTPPFQPKLLGFLPILVGSIILIWISELTMYEITTWVDSTNTLDMVLHSEPLGFGLNFLHYFAIGSILVIFGLTGTFLLKLIKKRGKN